MTHVVNEIVYATKDNSFTIEYTLDSVLYDFTNTTKVEVTLNGTSVDSVANSEYFDYSVGTDGRIIFKLGAAGYTPADSGIAIVTVFDAVNTNGVVFNSLVSDNLLKITVV